MRADTAQVAEGRRELLNALNLYTKGIVRLRAGIREALNPGGNSGLAKAKSAIKSMRKAAQRAGAGRAQDRLARVVEDDPERGPAA